VRLDRRHYPARGVDLPVFAADLDLNGHVNNVTLGRYFEQCRYDAQEAAGFQAVLGRTGGNSLVARAVYDYLAETLPGRPLHVRLRIERVGRTSVLEQMAAWQGEQCVALAEFTLVHREQGRPQPWPAPALEQFRAWGCSP
jgi:acyl-CoA thioester hydrolase